MPPEGSLRIRYAKWKQNLTALIKGSIRRQAGVLLASRETREYRRWISQRQRFRKAKYRYPPPPGLLSILTPVWNGSPIRYLRELARSILSQNHSGACEWVLLDNGCSNRKLIGYLEELGAVSWVKLHREQANLGITGGLRRCLEQAAGRYVLPVDADDLVYPDALQVIASAVVDAGYPPLLYTDEDKVIGRRVWDPYFKPDWDSVLLLNSAYVAHLGVIDREKALELGAYSDPETEGSPDWDLFVRFLIAGYQAIHVPEVVYSWRAHASSTATDDANKGYIISSQQKVLRRFLEARPEGSRFAIEPSPLFRGGAHWHLAPKREASRVFVDLVLGTGPAAQFDYASDPRQLAELARAGAEQDGFVSFAGEDVEIESLGWKHEVEGITDLHPDVVMVGGRIRDCTGEITEAGLEFGFEGICGSPNRGRSADDPGYFGQMWKQRSVSAVSTHFAVLKARFLLEVLESLPDGSSLVFLGAWAAMHAMRTGKRVVYSPFLSGVSDIDWEQLVSDSEKKRFEELNGKDVRDGRYYSRWFSRRKPFALGDPASDLN